MVVYVPDAKRTFVSLDAVFDEDFISPLSTPDLPFTGAIRLRNITSNHDDNNVVTEHTSEPTGHIQTFENEDGPLANHKETRNRRDYHLLRGIENQRMTFLLIKSPPFW